VRRFWTPDRIAGRGWVRREDPGHHPMPGNDPAAPRRRLAILCCMDCRVDPLEALGLRPGDAHVLRNAGARPTADVTRSLAQSQNVLGTRQVLVMGHTDCRALEVPGDPGRSVRHTVRQLAACEDIPHRAAVRGVVLDIDEGVLLPP
jgi:carbonic anhydrase